MYRRPTPEYRRDHPREYGENIHSDTQSYALSGSSPRIRGKLLQHPGQTLEHRIIPANTGKIRPTRVHRLFNRDHPREYGENVARWRLLCGFRGSSPRIRGKLADVFQCLFRCGIIPANTGKMCTSTHLPTCETDHPREYGENRHRVLTTLEWWGSSPRIRGKLADVFQCLFRCGIIPANTGKIIGGHRPVLPNPDHPREYGENTPPQKNGRT